ncbi:unnamed protein product, partial [Meganyctiphanes norvegica]
MSDTQSLQESQNLSMFLATQNKIRDTLKEKLQAIPTYEDLLCDVVNISVQLFENKMYLTPTEKQMLVKVMGFGLFLIDSELCSINKLDQKKKIKIDRIDKIFKNLEVVPLFGDMQIAPFNYIKRSKNFDPKMWPLCNTTNTSPQSDLMCHLPRIRDEHIKYISELARYSNEVITTYKETARTDAENKDIGELALRGLQLLSEWTSVVTELYSWKLLHPTDHHTNNQCPNDAEEYERAMNFKFQEEIRVSLIQNLPSIQNLTFQKSLILKGKTPLSDLTGRGVYYKMYGFEKSVMKQPKTNHIPRGKTPLSDLTVSVHGRQSSEMLHKEIDKDTVPLRGLSVGNKDIRSKVSVRSVNGVLDAHLMNLMQLLENVLVAWCGSSRIIRRKTNGFILRAIEEYHLRILSPNQYYLTDVDVVLHECCSVGTIYYREYYALGEILSLPISSYPWLLFSSVFRAVKGIQNIISQLSIENGKSLYALTCF